MINPELAGVVLETMEAIRDAQNTFGDESSGA
jgi:hypothetical protein